MDMRYVVPTICNIILNVLWILFLVMTLEPKHSRKRALLCLSPFIALMIVMCLSTPYSQYAPRILIFTALEFICSLFLFKDKWPRILLCLVLMYSIMLLCEFLFAAFLPQIVQSRDWLLSQSLATQINIHSFYLAMNFALLWIASSLMQNKTKRIPPRELIAVSLFPLSQMLLINMIFYLQTHEMTGIMTVLQPLAAVICLLADIPLFMTISNMEQRVALRVENQRLDYEVEAQRKYYAALSAQYENERFLQHDIANHMHTIRVLLESGKNQEATAYANELSPKGEHRPMIDECLNTVASAFLYGAIADAEAKGIAVKHDICLPRELGVANADLISVLGNLMDNAVEACAQSGKTQPRIEILAFMRAPYVCIETYNTLPEKEEHKRKHPDVSRGVGTTILSGLAQKYGGEYITEIKDGMYHARIALREAAAQNPGIQLEL